MITYIYIYIQYIYTYIYIYTYVCVNKYKIDNLIFLDEFSEGVEHTKRLSDKILCKQLNEIFQIF